jgi:hypothetical protein
MRAAQLVLLTWISLCARVALGKHAAAVEDFSLVLEMQPHNKEAQSKLAAATRAAQEQACTQ